MSIDLLVFGPHPDDIEIGLGGTVARHTASGHRVGLCDLTKGELSSNGTPEQRQVEAAAAADVLGALWRENLGWPDGGIDATPAIIRSAVDIIRRHRPRAIAIPHWEDRHPDHVAASALCDAARFTAKLVKIDLAGAAHWTPRLWHYGAVHLRLPVAPAFVLDAGEALPIKMKALRCYESQFIANAANAELLENIEIQARYWGGLIRRPAGEPFFAREPIGLTSITPLL